MLHGLDRPIKEHDKGTWTLRHFPKMNIKLVLASGAEVWEGHPGAKGDFAGAKACSRFWRLFGLAKARTFYRTTAIWQTKQLAYASLIFIFGKCYRPQDTQPCVGLLMLALQSEFTIPFAGCSIALGC